MITLLLCHELSAQERFEFNLGDKIQILSDKGYRHTADNRFEAVGNVIITHLDQAIYGEKATIALGKGETVVEGNVRYVGPEMTMHGAKLTYDIQTQKMDLHNGRIIADNYVILGKILSRTGPNTIYGEDAEYTTCRDCPEAWSVLGRSVHITLGEYIRIKNAYIKSKGVVVMYLPYMVLPIKKKRESGFLFPRFSFILQQGLRFQQPFFWNLADHKDATITPSLWGSRGQGGEVQYRHVFGDQKWMQIDTLHSWDRLYQEGKVDLTPTGNRQYRNYLEYEQFYIINERLTHHTYVTGLNDLDTVRDYDQFIGNKFIAPDTGINTHLDYNSYRFNLYFEGDLRRNMLVTSAKKFDDDFVQILPRVGYALTPFTLWDQGPFGLRKVTFNFLGDFTNFRQNRFNENNFIRNAYRTDNAAKLNVFMGWFGPVTAQTKVQLESQYYHFPKEQNNVYFHKYNTFHETEARFELDKNFSFAAEETYTAKEVEIVIPAEDEKSSEKKSNLVGDLPAYQKGFLEDRIKVVRSSYRHSQEYKVKHYFISDQTIKGSSKFLNQIRNSDGGPNAAGIFDPTDVIKGKENSLNFLEARTGLPTSNTVEFQWNNGLFKKTPKNIVPYENDRYVKEQFSYSQLSYFNISQGYDFNVVSPEIVDHLTRLALSTGVTFGTVHLRASEYYYHRNSSHITQFGLTKNFDRAAVSADYTYDSFTFPINKYANIGLSLKPFETTSISVSQAYDLERKLNLGSRYALTYVPMSNCWMTEIAMETNQIQKRISFNFLINYNNNAFIPLGAK